MKSQDRIIFCQCLTWCQFNVPTWRRIFLSRCIDTISQGIQNVMKAKCVTSSNVGVGKSHNLISFFIFYFFMLIVVNRRCGTTVDCAAQLVNKCNEEKDAFCITCCDDDKCNGATNIKTSAFVVLIVAMLHKFLFWKAILESPFNTFNCFIRYM